MDNTALKKLTIDDLSSVSEVHLRAFKGRALSTLGKEAVRRYYEWQLLGPHQSICLGAFNDNNLAGFCFGGVFRSATSGFLRKNKWYLTLRVITHPWLIASPIFRERLELGLRILRNNPKEHKVTSINKSEMAQIQSFGILAIGVDPRYQGFGYGKKLMMEEEKNAIEQGFQRMQLSVDKNNYHAIGFYESLGWKKEFSLNGNWSGLMIKWLSPLNG